MSKTQMPQTQEWINPKGQQNFSTNNDQHTYLAVTKTNIFNDRTKNLRQLFPMAFDAPINEKDRLINPTIVKNVKNKIE